MNYVHPKARKRSGRRPRRPLPPGTAGGAFSDQSPASQQSACGRDV